MRRRLPHDIPSWVDDGAVFFITINCVPRGMNQLARPGVAAAIESSLRYYQTARKWWIHHFLLMPDHLHGLISFSQEAPMRRTISDWKRFVARTAGIDWQRDFFDHRIRNDESQSEKWHYIRANPVRKGLVADPDAWPYQWSSMDLSQGTAASEKPPCLNQSRAAASEKPPYLHTPTSTHQSES